MEPDWSDGDYGRTAEELAPVAELLVEAIGVDAGWTVLDVACGTGNAVLAAARRGARAIGVDPARGLLEAGRRRAAAAGLDAEFRYGDAGALPVPDAAFDAVVSVFGVIFAADARRAVGELVRVLRPGGTLALTAWLPGGAIRTVAKLLAAAIPDAAPPTNRWDDPAWIEALLRACGATAIAMERHELVFRAPSPEAWLSGTEAHHPVWRWARRRVAGERWERLHADSLAALRAENEDEAGFATTSAYLLVRCRR